MKHSLSWKVRLFAVAVSTGLLAAPAFADEADYITNAKEIVNEADWKAMKTVTVLMGERGNDLLYMPETLTFEAGQPYKLEMVNKGKNKHYFTATEFFKSIATRKVQSNKDGEVKAPYFTALEMMPKGGQLDLYFVPVKKGTYEVTCTIDDHAERGMVGTIVVQ